VAGHSAKGSRAIPPASRKALDRATMTVQALLDDEAEELTRKCIELARAGDTTALRLCMQRLAPAVKARAVSLPLPPIDTPADILKAQGATIQAMADGEITPNEAVIVTSGTGSEAQDHRDGGNRAAHQSIGAAGARQTAPRRADHERKQA
jgi:hypothetical protein